MEEVNIFIAMLMDRGPKLSFPSLCSCENTAPRTLVLFSIQALVFIGLARRFYIYLQIYNK